jgi:hypothetical protein
MPAARRISHTVDGATAMPSFVSSPWIRRCPVDAGKGVTLCDPGVFADEAAETVSPQNTHAALLYGWMDAPGGRTLLQRPVRPMSVVLVGVLREGTAGTAARPAGVMRPVLA